MGWNNKVIWSEGMFLRPQHFQQHDRYLQTLVEGRAAALRSFSWGVTALEVDQRLLSLGKLAITRCEGVLPDGTPINIPENDDPPAPLEVPEDAKNVVMLLALPVRRVGAILVDGEEQEDSLARYARSEYEVRDNSLAGDEAAALEVGRLRLKLMLASDNLSEYTAMGVARVVERRADNNVLLDESYIAPCLDLGAAPRLQGFVKELLGLLHHRAEALAGRVSESGRGGAAEIADFLFLQSVNRAEPLLAHLASISGTHPEIFYRMALPIAGDLATFTSDSKRPPELPAYLHEDLDATFTPLMRELRRSLSTVLEQNAIAIPLQEKRYGIRVGTVADLELVNSASFVLAVNAQIPADALRTRFPAQIKIGPTDQIRQLVNSQIPGVGLRMLPVTPRQIPYHAGFTYFELDRSSDFWKPLTQSGAFAFHIAGDFPGLELEFWAIRS